MKRSIQATLAAVAAASTLISSPVVYASGGSCLPRTLTPAEKEAGERVAARLRPLLPPAPAGWKADGADFTEVVSGSCFDPATRKSLPQPVSVQVRRTFVREGPPPTAPTATTRPTPPAAVADAETRARVQALEQQIRDLQRKEQAATAAYQAARVAGDSEAQRKAVSEAREIRLAMSRPRQELMELRRAEHQQREAQSAALREAGVAQNTAMLANRRRAHITFNTNSGRALARASKVVSVPGVPLAIAQPAVSMNLLFGSGWTHQGHQAWRPWDQGAPTSRVQDVNVLVDGPEEVMHALIRELDLKALEAVIER